MAATQTEQTGARAIFPCLDEPSLKASWELSIIRDNRYFESCYSNTPLISTTSYRDIEWSIDKFEQSVKIPSYLISFVVSNFKKIEKKSPKYGVTVQIAAKQENIVNGDGDSALDLAAEIIDFYSDYFNIPYPAPKFSNMKIYKLFQKSIKFMNNLFKFKLPCLIM